MTYIVVYALTDAIFVRICVNSDQFDNAIITMIRRMQRQGTRFSQPIRVSLIVTFFFSPQNLK